MRVHDIPPKVPLEISVPRGSSSLKFLVISLAYRSLVTTANSAINFNLMKEIFKMNITVNDLLKFVTDNSITCKLGPNSVVIPGTELTKFAVADLPVPSGLRLSRLDISIDEQVNYKLALATNPDTPEPVQAICIQKDRPADDKAIRAKLDSLLK